jgi:CBS domain-containing protein
MFSIRRVLEDKASKVIWSVRPDDTVLSAITRMAEQRIGAVLVMEGEELRGILSERDYSRKIILQGRRSAETRVSEIMTRDVMTVPLTMTARQGLELMTANYFRHLPVVDEGRVVGVVSIGDLVKRVIAEQDFLIEQLEQYIAG